MALTVAVYGTYDSVYGTYDVYLWHLRCLSMALTMSIYGTYDV